MGDYHVEWTNDRGNPGFASIKYETQFNGFSKGAQDVFALTVSNFDPALSIQIQMKAGKDRTTFTLTLRDFACDRTPTPTPTAMPISPLPTPTVTAPFSETISTTTVMILGDELFNQPLAETEKQRRWQQGLPVPLLQIDDESNLPIEWGPWSDEIDSAKSNRSIAQTTAVRTSQRVAKLAAPFPAPIITDGWTLTEYEEFEEPGQTSPGCRWRSGYRTSGASYLWGRDDLRAKDSSYGFGPAGSPQNGAPVIPDGGSYPDDLETWWQCELTLPSTMDNIMTEFELWHELDTVGDQLGLRFHDVGCEQSSNASYQGGIYWQGTDTGIVNLFDLWKNYRVYYPTLQSNDNGRICIEFKFTSDNDDNNFAASQGPWLDNVQMSIYQKPATSLNCQEIDPTVNLLGAPGSGNVSKALVVPPYADDLKAGVLDDPNNMIDIAGMVQRLLDANVHWVRLEFVIPPEDLQRIGYGLDPKGVSRVDLRHFDRIIDMLCANNIAVLGLVDYQTLERQDWDDDLDGYIADFTGSTKQLVNYFDDRIGYWEVWNEPNFVITEIEAQNYARLLIAAYDAVQATDADDQVLFAGLAQAGDNSFAYFEAISDELSSQGRQNPAPYDILALHPYPSDEYIEDGRVVVDPQRYLHWREEDPQPTIIHKFLDRMVDHGKENQPLWITELGWNRAQDSTNAITQNCPAVTTTWVDGYDQALYQLSGFDILFKETAWDSGAPSINKIFWYQYVDVGIPESACFQVTGANTPSGPTSFIVQGAALQQPQQGQADWWFGLYSGIDHDPDKNGISGDTPPVIHPNWVQCTFSKYPINQPIPILECLSVVYLPLIQDNPISVNSQ